MKDRFKIVKKSKFETLTPKKLELIKGGGCISCMKRTRRIRISTPSYN